MSDKVLTTIKNLDRGFYTAAQSVRDGRTGDIVKRSSYGYLTDMLKADGVGPTQDDVDTTVKRLLVNAGVNPETWHYLSETKRESYTKFAEDIWGLNTAMQAVGVRVKGAGADRLEKFFSTAASTVLFPAYVESQVMVGYLATAILQDLIATETNISSHTYQSCVLSDTEADRRLHRTTEGAVLPKTKIVLTDKSISLRKFGRLLEASYEALRLQKMNVVSLFLQRVGTQVALDETDWAIETLISGDGTANSGAVDVDAENAGTLDYDELVRLFLAFPDGYKMTTVVAKDAQIRTILNMSEFKDPTAGFNFQKTGILPGPMGATWHRWNSTGAPAYNEAGHTRMLAIDNSIALEQITEQGLTTESDRLIDRQLERTAITKWTGFAKLDPNATHPWDLGA